MQVPASRLKPISEDSLIPSNFVFGMVWGLEIKILDEERECEVFG